MSFRGIGDTATQVKLQQDAQAASAAAAAASRDLSAQQAKAGRAQQAEQFNAEMAQREENNAWTRSQAEQKTAEDTRRYGIAQQASERQEVREAAKLGYDKFRLGLDRQRTEAELKQRNLQTQVADMEYSKWKALADEETKERETRDRDAKSAFGGLMLAGRENGGVFPVKAIEYANQILGDKNIRIIGGGFTKDDIAFFNIETIGADGKPSVATLKMTPEKQYSAMYGGFGREKANMWNETYKAGSAARIAADKTALEYQMREELDRSKQTFKQEMERNDPRKQADEFDKAAKNYTEMADYKNSPKMTQAERDDLIGKAAVARFNANQLRETGTLQQPEKIKPFAITPELQKQYGITSANNVQQKPDGGAIVTWKVGKDTYKMELGPDGKEIGGSAAPAPKPAPTAQAPTSQPADQKPVTREAPRLDQDSVKEFARYGIRVMLDDAGNIKSAEIGNNITGWRNLNPNDVLAEYDRRRKSKADAENKVASAKKKEEDDKLAKADALEKARQENERMFGKGFGY